MKPLGYKLGPSRPYYSTEPNALVVAKSRLNRLDHFAIFLVLGLAVIVRLYKLPIPDEVVFDEVHFGGFAQDYYQGKFFVDVHPALVKLMYYWVAALCGWDGQFEFAAIGDQFDKNVPFIAMRLLSGVFGVGSVVWTYLGLRVNFTSSIVAFFGALMMIIENSMVTQSRFIFLDSALLFCMSMTWYLYGCFKLQRGFSFQWYQYLWLTGLSLGLTISTKSSGLLVYIWVGLITLIQMWYLLGDLQITDLRWWKHLGARIGAFIIIPWCVFAVVFAMHLEHVRLLGRGSGLMSPNFKASARDSRLNHQPVEVGYGSSITLKHNEVKSYLHSHPYDYKTGSKLQQVTLYGSHTDFSNEWEIHPKNKRTDEQLHSTFTPVKNGDIVRLYHKHTKKFLSVSGDHKPPLSEKDYAKEVCCNGTRDLLGDINYEFRVQILDKKPHAKNDLAMIKLRATESVFQLVHKGTHCHLLSHEGKLPKWGFGQNEVLCIKEATIPNTLWYIEKNTHPALKSGYETADLDNYPFYKKFWEYHTTIWKLNQDLTDHHPYASNPITWPITSNGINYFSSSARPKNAIEEGSQVYLLGNLALYYLSIISVGLIGLKQVLYILKHLNPFKLYNEPIDTIVFYETTLESILGFVVNYVPYFYMNRQLFLHHYLPALYFGIITMVYFIEFEFNKRRLLGWFLMISVGSLSLFCFISFMPLIYGGSWTQQECRNMRWFETWDFDCMTYKY